jgi:hypothetical protein
MLTNVLRGSHNAEIRKSQFDQIKTFGAGAAHSFHDWSNYLLQLIQVGAMEIAYDDNNSLRVTQFGKMIVEGNIHLDLIKPSVWQEGQEKQEESPVTAENNRDLLFEKLRQLRMQVARERNLPPYIVFGDFTLKQMTERVPVTETDMLMISGMTRTKYDDFGYRFLARLREEEGIGPLRRINPDDYLTEQKLKEYAEELTARGINPSHGTVAKILLGSDKKPLEKAKDISFYGVLNGHARYTTLAPRLKEYYQPILEQRKEQHNSVADKYFNAVLFNNISKEKENEFRNFLNVLPLERTGDKLTDFIREQRKTHARASEPWSENEKTIFFEAVRLTNDLSFLCRLFQRSPNAVKAMAAVVLS